jgi:hypothetical protein
MLFAADLKSFGANCTQRVAPEAHQLRLGKVLLESLTGRTSNCLRTRRGLQAGDTVVGSVRLFVPMPILWLVSRAHQGDYQIRPCRSSNFNLFKHHYPHSSNSHHSYPSKSPVR